MMGAVNLSLSDVTCAGCSVMEVFEDEKNRQ